MNRDLSIFCFVGNRNILNGVLEKGNVLLCFR